MMQTTLKQNSDANKEQKIENKQLKQNIKDRDEVNTKLKAENSKLSEEKEELAVKLAEAEKMLAQTTGYQVMKQQIDMEKKNTRDALSQIAERERKRSAFHSPSKSVSLPFDSVSHVDSDHMNRT